MKIIKTRKTIALGSFAVLSAVLIYVVVTGKEINQSAMFIATGLMGAIQYYFANRTTLDQQTTPKEDKTDE